VSPLPPSPPVFPFGHGKVSRWISAFGSVAQVAVLAVVAYALLFHLSVVRGSSMVPGIRDGDRILVDHLSYVLGDVRRGDVVVLRCPIDPSLDYIKRVIALPGDEVAIDQGGVFVNGERIEEPYVAGSDGAGSEGTASDGPASERRLPFRERVGSDHYFVLGDNRDHSSDSREFGQVSRDLLRGRVDFRVWPPERAGTVR
jgi:signal peptidase I